MFYICLYNVLELTPLSLSLDTLDLIVVVTEFRHLGLETLAFTDFQNNIVGFRSFLKAITVNLLPVIEHHLGESLTRGVLAQQLCETERLQEGTKALTLHKGVPGRSSLPSTIPRRALRVEYTP